MDKTILLPPSMYGFNISETFDFRPFFQPCIRTGVMELSTQLVGCFGFNGPLRQYFSLYRAVSQREGERGEKG